MFLIVGNIINKKYIKMEENKKGCCEDKENCNHGMANCCNNWKKCPMVRRIIWIVIIIIAFCLGSQWGEMKSEFRRSHYERGGMMNWNYGNKLDAKARGGASAVDEVTIEVKNPVAPIAPKQ